MIKPATPRRPARTSPDSGLTPCIPFDRTSRIPYYTQLYDGFRMAIISGRLVPGQRLPSTRALADELQISRYPVFSAFDQLLHDGYLEGRVGSGTYVRDRIPDDLAKPILARNPSPPAVDRAASQPGAAFALREAGLGLFSVGVPALDRFPQQVFSRLVRRHAAVPAERLAYGGPAGHLPLREAIADYLRTSRAVDCDADQVLIVTGSQMGLIISALGLTTPDSSVCIEEPGYPGIRQALAISGAGLIRVGVDDQGIDVAAIKRLPEAVSLVCVTPSHQYPLGVSMEMTRRLELLTWATERKIWVVEDDYDGEYRYCSRPLGALQGMSTSGRVIYIGTFSKVLFPALRVGYVVVPRELLELFIRIRIRLDVCPPALYQLVLTDFLNEGHFGRHLRRMRALYLSRRDALVAAIHERASDVLTIENTDAGLHLVAFLPTGVNDREVVRRAVERGMYPRALSNCYTTSAVRMGLILGFAGSDEITLASGVSALADVIRRLC